MDVVGYGGVDRDLAGEGAASDLSGEGMTIVELFAGAGGASLGLLRTGYTEVRAVEWNADACATRREGGLRCDEGDVRDPKHYEGVTADALWSSFPCQAWSTAGKRLGKDDPRNGWPWTVDVIDQVKPRWFMAENVPGLTFHRGGCNGRCVDDCARLYLEGTILADLRARFAVVEWRVLDAARYGVPQNRERLFIVAGPRAIRWPTETHAPPEELRQGGLFGDSRRPWVTVRQALNLDARYARVASGIAESDPGTHGVPRTCDTAAPTVPVGSHLYLHPNDAGPRVYGGGKRGHGMAEWEPADVTDRPAATISAMQGSTAGHYVVEDPRHPHARPDEPAPTLRSGGAGHSSPPMWLNTTVMREDPSRGWEAHSIDDPSPAVRAGRPGGGLGTRAGSRPEMLDRPSPTVTTCEVKGTRGETQHGGPDRASDAAWLGAGIRRLTPAECAILQDFPPDHPWQGTKTSIYAQIGNSVPPTLACAVATAVREADQ